MARFVWNFQTILLSSGLAVAIAGLGAVLYFVESPAVRVGAGLLFLAVIIWASGRLRVVETVLETVSIEPAEDRRRHRTMRATVDRLIDLVRRMNGLALDVGRGFRERNSALTEMDALENKMVALIKDIRGMAGLTDQQLSEQKTKKPEPAKETGHGGREPGS